MGPPVHQGHLSYALFQPLPECNPLSVDLSPYSEARWTSRPLNPSSYLTPLLSSPPTYAHIPTTLRQSRVLSTGTLDRTSGNLVTRASEHGESQGWGPPDSPHHGNRCLCCGLGRGGGQDHTGAGTGAPPAHPRPSPPQAHGGKKGWGGALFYFPFCDFKT